VSALLAKTERSGKENVAAPPADPSISAAVSIACSITGIWLFVEFEINQLARFRVFSGQILSHLPLELFFGQNLGLVQPGCTIELLTIAPSR
jgi:hypothetical protein